MPLTTQDIQNAAIRAMAPGRTEYNEGVLSMLGKRDLALAHETALVSRAVAIADLHATLPQLTSFADLLQPGDPAAAAELDRALEREAACWAPIQAIIDRAQADWERSPNWRDEGHI